MFECVVYVCKEKDIGGRNVDRVEFFFNKLSALRTLLYALTVCKLRFVLYAVPYDGSSFSSMVVS